MKKEYVEITQKKNTGLIEKLNQLNQEIKKERRKDWKVGESQFWSTHENKES